MTLELNNIEVFKQFAKQAKMYSDFPYIEEPHLEPIYKPFIAPTYTLRIRFHDYLMTIDHT